MSVRGSSSSVQCSYTSHRGPAGAREWGSAPRQYRRVRLAKTGVRPSVRRRRDFADRQLHRADGPNHSNRGGDADAEFDVELPRLIHRVAIDKDVLAVQLNATCSRGVDLIQMALEFHGNPTRREARVHRRDESGCGALQRGRIAASSSGQSERSRETRIRCPTVSGLKVDQRAINDLLNELALRCERRVRI